MKKLVILRGNSGSGKTTVARALHDDVQGLPGCGDGGASSENAGGRAEGRLPAGQGKQDPVCPGGA